MMQKCKSGVESRLQAGGTCSGNSYPTVSAWDRSGTDRDLVVQDDAYTADLLPNMVLIDLLERVIDVQCPAFDAASSILC